MVEGRYNEPVEPSPDVELIGHYCWLAEPKNGAPENERDAAVASLIDLYREQRAQVQSGNLPTIDPRLLLFIRAELGRCILSPDPLNAIELLLERRRRPRGRPKTPHRDFVIAGDVAEKVETGMTIESACADVAEAACLSEEEVRRIYFGEKKADGSALKTDLVRRKAERESLRTVRAELVALLRSRVVINTIRAKLAALLKSRVA
jgi:hypothetical protein